MQKVEERTETKPPAVKGKHGYPRYDGCATPDRRAYCGRVRTSEEPEPTETVMPEDLCPACWEVVMRMAL